MCTCVGQAISVIYASARQILSVTVEDLAKFFLLHCVDTRSHCEVCRVERM